LAKWKVCSKPVIRLPVCVDSDSMMNNGRMKNAASQIPPGRIAR
jgi:hypothetical protein